MSSKHCVLEAFRDLVGPEEILEAASRLGAIKRQRKVDMPALVQATIVSVLPTPGVQTTTLFNYLSLTGVPLAHSAFYDRFTPEFGSLMQELAARAVEGVRLAAPVGRGLGDLGVLLKDFKDVQLANSTCLLLQKLAQNWAPSTSKVRPAGVKWHALISVKDGLPVGDNLTPQRTHDNAALPEEALAPGTLTLFDLGYLDVKRFIDAIERGAHFLTRLKTGHNPAILRDHVSSRAPPGIACSREAGASPEGIEYSTFHSKVGLGVAARGRDALMTEVVANHSEIDAGLEERDGWRWRAASRCMRTPRCTRSTGWACVASVASPVPSGDGMRRPFSPTG